MTDRAAIDADAWHAGAGMRNSYIRVVVSWLLVLAALYAFQEYFS